MYQLTNCEWNTLSWILIQEDHYREKKIRAALRAERKAAKEAGRTPHGGIRALHVPRGRRKGRKNHDAHRIADRAS